MILYYLQLFVVVCHIHERTVGFVDSGSRMLAFVEAMKSGAVSVPR